MVADLLKAIAIMDAEKARRDEAERMRKLEEQRRRDALRYARFERQKAAKAAASGSDGEARVLKKPISAVSRFPLPLCPEKFQLTPCLL